MPLDQRVHATIPPGSARPKVAGLTIHTAIPARAIHHQGQPITAPEPNFIELASALSLVELVILGDAMVRQKITTPTDLRAVARTASGRGVARARRAADLVEEHIDSPMETRTRLLVVLAGLPCPEPGLPITDELGQWLATPDLQYRKQRIPIEYDGDLHRTEKRKWRRDIANREELREHGWWVIVLTADDILRRPERTLQRIHRALLERGHPDLPTEPGPAWPVQLPAIPRYGRAV